MPAIDRSGEASSTCPQSSPARRAASEHSESRETWQARSACCQQFRALTSAEEYDNCRDAGRCGSCTPRLSSLGRLSTPKALGRLKAMTEGSAESVTPEQVEEAGDVLSA